jgi:hypothetical protein
MKSVKNVYRGIYSIVFLVLLGNSTLSHAELDITALTSDINQLVQQGNGLVASTTLTMLTPFTAANQLASLQADYSGYTESVMAVYNSVISTPAVYISLTDNLLIAMQSLSATNTQLAMSVTTLSAQVLTLSSSIGDNAFFSMLSLSSDIGVMANRILEMADKILLMADNIGIMADRILATQLTLMLHKISAQDRFAASIAAFSGPCSLFLILT